VRNKCIVVKQWDHHTGCSFYIDRHAISSQVLPPYSPPHNPHATLSKHPALPHTGLLFSLRSQYICFSPRQAYWPKCAFCCHCLNATPASPHSRVIGYFVHFQYHCRSVDRLSSRPRERPNTCMAWPVTSLITSSCSQLQNQTWRKCSCRVQVGTFYGRGRAWRCTDQ
jgi:hypothetical protein